ncbi:hypothetical protein V4D30_01830 [Thermodesulfovibrio sp. 3907-1M]|uniref:Secreted protein n=1 Tax=Thermodesulfovibrio autotrophicus TaxID=3118333 RepID=A0AAU8GY84_9BACT
MRNTKVFKALSGVVVLLLAVQLKGICRSIGLNQVPALLCRCPDKTTIYFGDSQIMSVLKNLLVTPAQAEPQKETQKTKIRNKTRLNIVRETNKNNQAKIDSDSKENPNGKERMIESLPKENTLVPQGGFCPIDQKGDCR